MMEDWVSFCATSNSAELTGPRDQGILTTAREYDEVQAFDAVLGLRELRAKVNGKFDIGQGSSGSPNSLSINAEFNLGYHSIEIVRKYLESGALRRLLERDLNKERSWSADQSHKYITLLACCITLGVDLSIFGSHERVAKQAVGAIIQQARELAPYQQRSELALQQVVDAFNRECETGVPYDFGNRTMFELHCAPKLSGPNTKTRVTAYPSFKFVEVVTGSMTQPLIIGPTDHADSKYENYRVYPVNVCAYCGSSEARGGERALMGCGRCRDRKYCSKDCQKKHWKVHKIICTIPDQEMTAFLSNLPPGIKDEETMAKDDIRKALKDDTLAPCDDSKGFSARVSAAVKGGRST